MYNQQNMEAALWNYIDGTSDSAERQRVEELLRTEAQWQACYAGLLDTHRLMQGNISLDQPSLRFTRNVMEEIARTQVMPAVKQYINPYIIRGIGGFFLVTIAGLLIYILAQANWSASAVTDTSVPYLSRFNWGLLLSGTYLDILMMANIVLALMLLDVYLVRRKRAKLRAEG